MGASKAFLAALERSSRPRVYHRASLIGPDGQVSALCFKKPRAIDLNKRQTWTLRDEAVTCPECRKIISAKRAATPPETPGDPQEKGSTT